MRWTQGRIKSHKMPIFPLRGPLLTPGGKRKPMPQSRKRGPLLTPGGKRKPMPIFPLRGPLLPTNGKRKPTDNNVLWLRPSVSEGRGPQQREGRHNKTAALSNWIERAAVLIQPWKSGCLASLPSCLCMLPSHRGTIGRLRWPSLLFGPNRHWPSVAAEFPSNLDHRRFLLVIILAFYKPINTYTIPDFSLYFNYS
jgi:hypothetical protein